MKLKIPILVIALAFLTYASAVFFPIKSDDLFMYLSIGRRLFENRLTDTDPFLYSMPNSHWHIAHEWLSYVIFYAVYWIGDFTGLIIGKTILLTATAIIAGLPLIRKKNIFLLPLLLVSAYAGSLREFEKASLFSDLSSLILILLLLNQNWNKRIWTLGVPVLFVLWTNLHPGFPIGFVLLAAGAGAQLLKKNFSAAKLLIFSILLSALACLINPIGLSGLIYPFERFLNPQWNVFRTHFYEWLPTLMDHFWIVPEVLALIAMWGAAVALLIRNRKQLPIMETVLLLIVILMGAQAVRFMLFSAFGALLICGHLLPDFKASARAWIVAGFLQLTVLIRIIGWGYPTQIGPVSVGTGISESAVPLKAVKWIEDHNLQGNVFNETDWGSYLAWRWDGQRKVFYHGHIDDPSFLDKVYMKVYGTADEFNKLIADYDIQIFLLRSRVLVTDFGVANKNLIREWQNGNLIMSYEDENSMVLVRKK